MGLSNFLEMTLLVSRVKLGIKLRQQERAVFSHEKKVAINLNAD
jgi:hypothetical protein